ncbi:hypothetical protein KCM76_24200 [Zooshikella marina]|uniref:hypothetical protein n=1 Tax=Zooshikella ganghwensis TaxID=202772 RepID=UPI001BAEBFDD|nr:hypothetical protein [Zooshikella ganghwensis]MBU2709119.1 hypothetical protein [Zooshikella ganghwensis]
MNINSIKYNALAIIFLLFSLNCFSAQSIVLNNVANTLYEAVNSMEDHELYEKMKKHYQTLRLLDNNDQWATERLSLVSDQLLPSTINNQNAIEFINQTVYSLNKNEYLLNFFEKAKSHTFNDLINKSSHNRSQHLADVIAYALVQQYLTTAMYDDWRIIEDCKTIWSKTRDETDFYDHMGLFAKVKLVSVEYPISRIISFHKENNVPEYFTKLLLPLNIIEAVAVDTNNGFLDNAIAGLVLAANNPGDLPSRFNDNHKSILISMPLPEKWADLYSVWNLAFVSHYEYFPYTMVKLVIPKVSDYHDQPDEYIYNRALALYTHLHFTYLGSADRAITGETLFDWSDKEFTKLFGEVNRASAYDYEKAVIKYKISGSEE